MERLHEQIAQLTKTHTTTLMLNQSLVKQLECLRMELDELGMKEK